MFHMVNDRTRTQVRTSICAAHDCSPRNELKGSGCIGRGPEVNRQSQFSPAPVSLGIFGLAVGPTPLHHLPHLLGRELTLNGERLSTRRKLLDPLEPARSQSVRP